MLQRICGIQSANLIETGGGSSETFGMRTLFVIALLSFVTVSRALMEPGAEVTSAAKALLATLTPEQAAKAKFEWTDQERFNWHFIPKERKGLPLREMTPAQQPLAFALLNATLSQRGFLKATTIMSLEQILLDTEGGRGPKRDPANYFVSIFGEPGAKSWGWRYEGHHQSFNFTMAGDKIISGTPNFYGTNPAEVREGPRKGLRVLGLEEDLGRELVKSLNDDQKKLGIYTNVAPKDIITMTNRVVGLLQPAGLPMSKMDKKQKEILSNLIKEYVYRYREDAARAELEKIQSADQSKIFFTWAGPTERGEGHYYRVQGPAFLIEYDNTQNNANHVHAVMRNLQNDFGDDVLKRHYEENHK
jgi:hypothetical protein